jgi:hypothetical protein
MSTALIFSPDLVIHNAGPGTLRTIPSDIFTYPFRISGVQTTCLSTRPPNTWLP